MTVYIHIGAQKTGSTTIQKYLYDNRKALAKSGVHYPAVDHDDTNITSHYNSVRGIFSDDDYWYGVSERFFDRVNRLNGNVVISAENLSAWPALNAKFQVKDHWRQKREALLRLRDAIADPDVRIIFCTRNRFDFLKSLFNQHLKVTMQPALSLEDSLVWFLTLNKHLIYYRLQADLWREIFGQVEVINYEDYKNGGLLDAFMKSIDCDLRFPEPARQNASVDWASLEARRVNVTLGGNISHFDKVKAAEFNKLAEYHVSWTIRRFLARHGFPGAKPDTVQAAQQ